MTPEVFFLSYKYMYTVKKFFYNLPHIQAKLQGYEQARFTTMSHCF